MYDCETMPLWSRPFSGIFEPFPPLTIPSYATRNSFLISQRSSSVLAKTVSFKYYRSS